jgi:hypothetical protein
VAILNDELPLKWCQKNGFSTLTGRSRKSRPAVENRSDECSSLRHLQLFLPAGEMSYVRDALLMTGATTGALVGSAASAADETTRFT